VPHYLPGTGSQAINLPFRAEEGSSGCIPVRLFDNAQGKKKEKVSQKGEVALRGEDEFLRIWLFREATVDRRIRARGESIMVYDPSKENEPAYWLRENISVDDECVVPAGYVVRVIKAWIKFI